MKNRERETLTFFDFPIEQFADRSTRWLLEDGENVRGLLEMAQTMAEYLMEQGQKLGEKLGEERGEKLGEERGQIRAKREAVLKLLRFRFDTVPESVSCRIVTLRSLSHLDSLFEKALAAQTLDDIDWEGSGSGNGTNNG